MHFHLQNINMKTQTSYNLHLLNGVERDMKNYQSRKSFYKTTSSDTLTIVHMTRNLSKMAIRFLQF